MTPDKQTFNSRFLVNHVWVFQHGIDPAGDGRTRLLHHVWSVTAFNPLVIHTPDGSVVLPRSRSQAIVARQGIRIRTNVRCTLYVIVTAENVGATTGLADVAQSQLQDARCTNHRITDGVLCLTHTPNNGAGAIHGHGLRHFVNLCFRNAACLFNRSGGPLFHYFFANVIHAEYAVIDVLLIFPAIRKYVVQNAEQEWNIRA